MPGADSIAAALVNGIGDCEFDIPGHVVADIAVEGEPETGPDGSIALTIEALTVAE